jgi:hypothetical protein
MTFWRYLVWILTWLSANPADLPREHARAAAAISAARASMAVLDPAPAPTPPPGGCCTECKGTGTIIHGDGHRTPCPCPDSCACKQRKACPDDRCPVPGPPLVPVSPAKPSSGR